ncbi:hypothetical protein [Rhodohalobacter sp.]|uniref:hypothetical protein n=1 Tax=Rhodohalobacter sp. TaxID=1974210 RepID=UPI002ACD3E92|nr:hypothetical protein [Rhodohalobacter sp.]MDZ7756267.1 hypothetical protein [Rhodohalobacter sp.]
MGDSSSLSSFYKNNTLHGFGVQNLSSYDPEASFEKACEDALKDLNSNLFLSVYLETFKKDDIYYYNFPELSIQDSVLTYGEKIIKQDSLQINGQAVCVAGLSGGNESITAPTPDVYELMVSPQKIGDTWFAIGKSEVTSFGQSQSWMKAKNYAVKELAKVLKISVQSLKRQLEENTMSRMSEMTYFKSNLILENIHNVQRFTTQDWFVVVVAVKQEDILDY